MANMKQTAKIEIVIPAGNKWNVADVLRALKKVGIKTKTLAIMNHLDIRK